jgi:hypothetical protein
MATPQGDNPTNLVIQEGDGQATLANQAFPVALTVQALDGSGNPVSGAGVTFSPLAGSTGANVQPPLQVTVLTDGLGIATLPVQAGLIPGHCRVAASLPVGGPGSTVTFRLHIISKLRQIPAALPWSLNLSPNFVTGAIAGDLDLDGRWELISPTAPTTVINSLGVFSFFKYGDLLDQWSTSVDTGQMVTQGCYGTIPGQDAGVQSWMLGQSDQYCAADLDGDGATEILVVNLFSHRLGVFKWLSTSLKVIYAAPLPADVPTNTTAGLANLGTHQDQQDAAGELVVIWDALGDNGAQAAAVFYWANNGGGIVTKATNLQLPVNALYNCVIAALLEPGPAKWIVTYENATNVFTAYNWQADQGTFVQQGTQTLVPAGPPFWVYGDLDGDGRDEFLTYTGTPSTTNMTGWLNDGFTLQVLTNSFMFPSAGPPTPAVTAVVPIPILVPGQVAVIFEYRNQLMTCFVQAGDTNYLAVYFGQVGSLPPVSDEFTSWTIGTDDQILALDLDADGFQELVFCQANQFAVAKISQASFLKGFQTTGTTSMAISGWAPNLVAGAPSLNFAAAQFTGDQAAIYSYVSCQVTSDSPPNSQGTGCSNETGTIDIRSLYTDASETGNFGGWAVACQDLPNPEPGSWSVADWDSVVTAVGRELQSASSCNTQNAYQQLFITALFEQQQSDFATVLANLTPNPPDPAAQSATTFWTQTITDALLAGLAAAPVGELLQIGLAITGSLYSSFMSKQPNEPTTFTFPESGEEGLNALKQAITLAFQAAGQDGTAYWQVILSDVNMLPDRCGISVASVQALTRT